MKQYIRQVYTDDVTFGLFGASSVFSAENKIITLIGGLRNGWRGPCCNFNFAQFDCNLFGWKKVKVNADNQPNISYAPSIIVKNGIYAFGGRLNSGEISDQVLYFEESTEGIVIKSLNEKVTTLCKFGHTVNAIGLNGEKLIFIGGISNIPTNDCEVVVWNDFGQSTAEVLKPAINGVPPRSRVHHTSTLVGSTLTSLLVWGGQLENGAITNDIYILDAAGIFLTNQSEVSKTKGLKTTSKSEQQVPTVSWSKVVCSVPVSLRCLHNALSLNSSNSMIHEILILGGLSDTKQDKTDCIRVFLEMNNFPNIVTNIEKIEWDLNELRYGMTSQFDHEKSLLITFGGSNKPHVGSSIVSIGMDNQINSLNDGLGDVALTAVNDESIKFSNGDTFKGDFIYAGGDKDDVKTREDYILSGYGTMSFANGDEYEGYWLNNSFHGFGRYSGKHVSFTGEWQNGLYSGNGKLVNLIEGFGYEGQFLNGKFHGPGRMTDLQKQETFVGEYYDGKRHGQGVISDECSNILKKGVWQSDRLIGIATIKLNYGLYEGEVRDDIPHGEGTCTYSNGNKYIGSWRSGKRNGYGEYSTVTGKVYSGKWVGDSMCGNGKWYSCQGNAYEGQWENGKPHGKGTMTFAKTASTRSTDIMKYSGVWKNGIVQIGVGTCTLWNGTILSGENAVVRIDDDQSIGNFS